MSYERDGVTYPSYGAYLRGKSLKVAYCRSHIGRDATAEKQWDAELNLFRAVTAQGIMPAGTSTRESMKALKLSEKHGHAYDAANPEGFARKVLGVGSTETLGD